MINYDEYDIEGLATDDFFRSSVIAPTTASEEFWQGWIARSHDHLLRYDAAKVLVLGLHKGFPDDLDDEAVRHKLEEIMDRMDAGDEGSKTAIKPLRYGFWIRIAAVLILATGFAWWFADHETPRHERPKEAVVATSPVVHKINSGDTEKTIILSDSSVLILSPGASVRYPAVFEARFRMVELEGTAFFEVSHHPDKPFLVQAGEIITKVLGTSFKIIAPKNSTKVLVLVKTGKVSVHRQLDFNLAALEPENAATGVILTRNEGTIFDKVSQVLERQANVRIKEEITKIRNEELIFDDTPVSEVFKQFEAEYGVDLEFDAQIFSSCPITTSFTDETLMERIAIVCETVGAHFIPRDGKIIITGSGCQR